MKAIAIPRSAYLARISESLERSPVTALLGPRQSGKTTLARQIANDREAEFLDLESRSDVRRLENPELYLGGLEGLVVIDEIQLMPDLLADLRVLVDRPDLNLKFLILGSASPHIVKGASETLAGRIEFVDLCGFDLSEVGIDSLNNLWLRGGFPRSFLAKSDEDSFAWRENFLRTFLERDLPQLGISIPAVAMRRFWTMLSHMHGQTWNASDLGRSMGLTDKTVKSYLNILTQTYMVRQLQPWFENVRKRQVKAPKIYFRDSGLLHSLLELPQSRALLGHPRLGASWEGFALEQVLQTIRPAEAYFWSTHSGAEMDLFFIHNGKRFGVEFKHSDAPKLSKSLYSAIDTLGLSHVWVVSRVAKTYQADAKITVCNLQYLPSLACKLG